MQDLFRNDRENNYITDETASVLKSAAQELSKCGISISIDSAIDKLAWFVGGDPAQIRRLQSMLNQLQIGEYLTVDGVYGTKTERVTWEFIHRLARGAEHSLEWVNPLHSNTTFIESHPITSKGETISSLIDLSHRSAKSGKGITVFRADTPHPGADYPHINTVETKSLYRGQYVPSSEFQYQNIERLNHFEISDDVYRLLKDFDGVAKKVRGCLKNKYCTNRMYV